jgi:hypothetical protein
VDHASVSTIKRSCGHIKSADTPEARVDERARQARGREAAQHRPLGLRARRFDPCSGDPPQRHDAAPAARRVSRRRQFVRRDQPADDGLDACALQLIDREHRSKIEQRPGRGRDREPGAPGHVRGREVAVVDAQAGA